MGSSFYFELPVYVSEASWKAATYLLPGTESSEVEVQTSNRMSYHRNRLVQYVGIGEIPRSSSSLDTNNATSAIDHQLVYLTTANQCQMNSHSDSSQLDADNTKCSLNGL